jgi:hypothetical protein
MKSLIEVEELYARGSRGGYETQKGECETRLRHKELNALDAHQCGDAGTVLQWKRLAGCLKKEAVEVALWRRSLLAPG